MVAPIGDIRPIPTTTPLSSADEGAVDQVFGLLGLAREEKLTDGRKVLDSFGIPCGRIHRTTPHRTLVERDCLGLNPAVGEHPEAPIAQGKRLHHIPSGTIEEVRECPSVATIGTKGELRPEGRSRASEEFATKQEHHGQSPAQGSHESHLNSLICMGAKIRQFMCPAEGSSTALNLCGSDRSLGRGKNDLR